MPSNSRKESYPIIKRWCVFFSFYSTFKYWILFLCYLRWVCKEMDPSETMLCISLSTIRRVSPFIWALECWISLSSDMSILLWCIEVVISLYDHSFSSNFPFILYSCCISVHSLFFFQFRSPFPPYSRILYHRSSYNNFAYSTDTSFDRRLIHDSINRIISKEGSSLIFPQQRNKPLHTISIMYHHSSHSI